MPNPEKPFEAALQAQYGYLAQVRLLDPNNPHGLAPAPDEFATDPPIRDGVIDTVREFSTLIRHQIYALGRQQYMTEDFPEMDLRNDTDDERLARAGLIAVLTMPENHEQRARRADVLALALLALRPEARSSRNTLFNGITRINEPGEIDFSRRMYALPFKEPPFATGSFEVGYDRPLNLVDRRPAPAFAIDFAKLIAVADIPPYSPDTSAVS